MCARVGQLAAWFTVMEQRALLEQMESPVGHNYSAFIRAGQHAGTHVGARAAHMRGVLCSNLVYQHTHIQLLMVMPASVRI